MNKLFQLKKWLTLADAAKHLAIAFGEEVTEADLIRLAIDDQLKISLRLVNSFSARPVLDSALLIARNEMISLRTSGVCADLDDDDLLISVLGAYLDSPQFDDDKKYGKEIELASGVWWLVNNGTSRDALERHFESLTQFSPRQIPVTHGSGIFIKGEYDYYYQLLSQSIPLQDFPADADIVVRTKAIQEFEQSANHNSTDIENAANVVESRHDNRSDKLAFMNQASQLFWSRADRDDRGTHPDNARVAAWLVQQGFSQTLADKAATIIRPEWAPTGRKPEE